MRQGPLLDILEELDIRVAHVGRDGWICAFCPFAFALHDRGADRTPDFYARIDDIGTSGFHCFACKQKGRISSLVRKLEHYRQESYPGLAIRADLAETPDSFAEWGERRIEERDPDPLNKAAYLGMFPLAWEHPDSRAYLISRGIGEATSEALNLQFDDDERRVLFPVFDHAGELYGFSGRTIFTSAQVADINNSRMARGFKLRYSKVRDYAGLPKERLLLGEHLIEEGKPLWIVEGLFAFAHMVEVGARELVNPLAPMGSGITPYQRDLLIQYNAPIWLCFDNDIAGDQGIFGVPQEDGRRKGGAVAMLRGQCPLFLPYYPPGVNDPDNLTLADVEEMLAGETYPLE